MPEATLCGYFEFLEICVTYPVSCMLDEFQVCDLKHLLLPICFESNYFDDESRTALLECSKLAGMLHV